MWLDMLVLRLMNQGRPGVRPVWLILDELQSLHALPQLHTAITESRKVKNPVVLGFQGRSQLEELYGRRKAEAMLSQPATKNLFYEQTRPTPRSGSARPSARWRSSDYARVARKATFPQQRPQLAQLSAGPPRPNRW